MSFRNNDRALTKSATFVFPSDVLSVRGTHFAPPPSGPEETAVPKGSSLGDMHSLLGWGFRLADVGGKCDRTYGQTQRYESSCVFPWPRDRPLCHPEGRPHSPHQSTFYSNADISRKSRIKWRPFGQATWFYLQSLRTQGVTELRRTTYSSGNASRTCLGVRHDQPESVAARSYRRRGGGVVEGLGERATRILPHTCHKGGTDRAQLAQFRSRHRAMSKPRTPLGRAWGLS